MQRQKYCIGLVLCIARIAQYVSLRVLENRCPIYTLQQLCMSMLNYMITFMMATAAAQQAYPVSASLALLLEADLLYKKQTHKRRFSNSHPIGKCVYS